MANRYKPYIPVFMLLILPFNSCKKYIDIDPPVTRIVTSSIYTNNAGATSAITAIYGQIMNGISSLAGGGFTQYAGLSADELTNFSTNSSQGEYFKNSLSSANLINQGFWNEGYNKIYAANAILEGLANSNGVTSDIKSEIEGEARFIRAFFHFMLVNMYGDIPIVSTTDYEVNATIRRSSVADVYQSILSDLIKAQQLLPSDYSLSDDDRIRPNKWAAQALMARVYLYMKDWPNAVKLSSVLISNAALFKLENDLNNVFLKNSNEAIWQLKPVKTNINTNEGQAFILTGTPNNCAISNSLLSSFELGDNRKANWLNHITIGANTYWFPFKYKVKTSATITEYYMVFRLAEQYLIRAEAQFQQNNINDGIADLNIIRSRASLSDLPTGLSKDDCLLALEQERRAELFCEWGHRWLDLKRTNRSDAILSLLKSPNWQSTDALYPIPQSQLLNDQNISQNPGY